MTLQKVLDQVEQSPQYTHWKQENPEAYLSSFFKIVEGDDKQWWQVDFYNPKNDTITSFVAEKEVKLSGKDSKIFKKDNAKVTELDISKVAVEPETAIKSAHDLIKGKYAQEEITKEIIILQHVTNIVWNISCVTKTLKLCNVKVDAQTGDVLEDSIKNLLEFTRPDAS